MADGTVKIDVQLILNSAQAQARALTAALKDIDIPSGAAAHTKELSSALHENTTAAKQTAVATKEDASAKEAEAKSAQQSASGNKQAATALQESGNAAKKSATASKEDKVAKDQDTQATERNANETKQAASAHKTLSVSLESQVRYWDNLSNAYEKVGLKTTATVTHLNSLKAQLAQTNAETETARNKLKELIAAEGEDSAATKQAASAYAELISKQAALGTEISQLSAKYGGLTPKMALMADKAEALGNKLQSAGQKMSSVGNAMTIGLTTPIIAGLGMAGKAAIEFDNQIKSMGALLDDGSKSSSQLKAELAGLGEASKKWSVEYGQSTTDLNAGMSELIKKGYSYNQVLGAMPSILDASAASQEDFNSVMSVSTSTLEQFGLKSNNTAQMLKNTQRVTDRLTFVANQTSTGFSDMGNAMQYVGPVAHGLNMSLEQTAAAIGLMSNQGIDGEKAGTALRGALTQLLTPTDQNKAAFKKLGVSVDAFAKGSIGLPDILDSIKEKSKGMTDQQLQSNLALAFGTEAQSGMNILVSEGGDALRKLTKETEKSDGYTHKLAETMNSTASKNVEKFKQSLNVLAITFGAKLMPAIQDLVEKGTDLINWFTDLDDGTQKLIIKAGLALAAGGPLLSLTGKLTSGIGGLVKGGAGAITWLSRFAGGSKKAASETEILTSILETLQGSGGATSKALGGIGTAAEGASVGLAGAGTEGAGFVGMLGTIGPAIAVAGLAVGAGIAYWELWGKKAVESAQRTQHWGSDVGKTADESLTRFENFQQKTATALNGFGNNANENAKKAAQGFKDMATEIADAGKKSTDALDKSLKGLPKDIANIVKEGAADRKAQINQAVSDAQSLSSKITKIQQKASSEKRSLTAEEKQFMLNAQRQMNADEINSLNISNSQKKLALRALNSDVLNMTKEQQSQVEGTLIISLKGQYDQYKKQSTQLKGLWESGAIDTLTYQDAINQLDKNYSAATDNMAGSMFKLMQSQGKDVATMTGTLAQFGISYDQAKQAAENMSTSSSKSFSMVADTASKMSGESRKAGQAWNDIVLDPKTGEVKTNLQETLNDAAKTNEGWSSMMFAVKNAKINSNAKAMVGIAAIQNGIWDNLTWQDKKAMIASNAGDTVVESLTANGTWNHLTFQQKSALLQAKGGPEVADIIAKAGLWNQMSLKDIKAMVATQGTQGLIDTLDKMGAWNQMSPKEQQAVVKAKGAPALADLVIKYGAWNNLPEKTKNLLIKNDDARKKLTDAGLLTDLYNKKPLNKKTAKADNNDFMTKMTQGNKTIDKLNQKKVLKKELRGDAKSIQNAGNTSLAAQNKHNNKKVNTKKLPGNASSIVNSSNQSTSAVDRHNSKPVSTKNLKGNASSVVDASGHAVSSIGVFNNKRPGLKNLKANDNASGPAGRASSAVDNFSRKKNKTITLTTVFNTIKNIFTHKGKKAHGDTYFGGGLAVVNDQPSPTFREAIVSPTGDIYSFKEPNVLTYIERGSEIIPAGKSRQMGLVPRYANGTGGAVTDAIDRYMNFTPEMASSFQPIDTTLTIKQSRDDSSKLDSVARSLEQLVVLLSGNNKQQDVPDVLKIQVAANIDGREVVKQLAPDISVELNRLNRSNMYRKGIV